MKRRTYKITALLTLAVFLLLLIAGRFSAGTVEEARADLKSEVYAEELLLVSVEEVDVRLKKIEKTLKDTLSTFKKLEGVSGNMASMDALSTMLEAVNADAVAFYNGTEQVDFYGDGVAIPEQGAESAITKVLSVSKTTVSTTFTVPNGRYVAIAIPLKATDADTALVFCKADVFVDKLFSGESYDFASNNAFFCLAESDGDVIYSTEVKTGPIHPGKSIYTFINEHIPADSTRITEKTVRNQYTTGERQPYVFELSGSVYVTSLAYAELLTDNYVLVAMTDYSDLSFGNGFFDVAFIVLAIVFALMAVAMLVVLCIFLFRRRRNKHSLTDPVYGFKTRRRFEKETVDIVSSTDIGYAVVCTDIEDFYLVSEYYGPQVAKDVIGFIGTVIQRSLTSGESYCYLGNSRFAFMLKRTNIDETITRIKLISDVVGRHKALFVERRRLGLKIGVYKFDDVYNTEEAMNGAILAMETHKRYPGVVCVYYEEAVEVSKKKAVLASEQPLDPHVLALYKREYRPFFRPVYCAADKRCVQMDVEIKRYDHETGQYLDRSEWKGEPLTDEQVAEMEFHVYKMVLRNLKAMDDAGVNLPGICFPLSTATVKSGWFPSSFMEMKKRLKLPNGVIVLRLAERDAYSIEHDILKVSKKMRIGGIRISFEGYGAKTAGNITHGAIALDTIYPADGKDGMASMADLLGTLKEISRHGIRTSKLNANTVDEFDKAVSLGFDTVSGDGYSKALTTFEMREWLENAPKAEEQQTEE